jgi:hypothetical protein
MDNREHYEKLAECVMESAWDIQDAIDGTNNHFTQDNMVGLTELKKQCEFFIKCYNDYVTETKAQ